jgi:succinate dehydrogenase/fumarate reductase cytochrome b subunit
MQYGDVARTLHRFSGAVIIVFVLVHVIVQAVRHVPMFASANAAAPWLQTVQGQNWIHAILFFCIAFHTLYGLKLWPASWVSISAIRPRSGASSASARCSH